MDSSSGIFRRLTEATTPLDIQYKQLLGTYGSDLYFRTLKGVERVDNTKVNTSVVPSKNGKIIQAAALNVNEVLYITNNNDDLPITTVNVFDIITSTNAVPPLTISSPSINSELAIKNLYANSMILVAGKNTSGNKVFELLLYDTGTDTFKKTTYGEFTSISAGYDIESVIQQTSKERDATAPMIVSFVKGKPSDNNVTYLHYVVDPLGISSQLLIGFDDLEIANFMVGTTNELYILTTNGTLYYAGTLGTVATKELMKPSTKTYKANAFAYSVHDGVGNITHLITKPSTKSSSFSVFTFPDATINSTSVDLVEVNTGYAAELSKTTIKSSFKKSSSTATVTDLLVATDVSGMFDITINHAKANKIDNDGSSSEAEGYSFPL